jgi:hypothetical protein
MADVVSTGEAFSSTDAQREIWDVATEVAVGTALVNYGRAGVAYVPSGGVTITQKVGPYTTSGIPAGGASLKPKRVTVATDGAYEFPVTGASATTVNGTPVYAVVTNDRVTELTLTATGNVKFGVVDNPADYVGSATAICVKIGV